MNNRVGIAMTERAATEIVNEALTAAVLDAVAAWKASAGGLTNVLARELGAVHVNATAADLPPAVRAALAASVRDTFQRLLKEGYTISKGGAPTPAPRPVATTVPRGGRAPQPTPRPAPTVEVRRPRSSPKGPPKAR